MPKIFISYRRQDSQWPVDRIREALKPHVADPNADIFVDVDSIPVGANFATYLDAKVAQCDVLLAVIGPGWLNVKDPKTGQRRLDDPKDFVRIEIASALRRGIVVAPVLLNGVRLPEPEELPENLRALVGRQGVDVSLVNFSADVQRLINGLGLGRPGLRPAPQTAAATAAAPKGSATPMIALALLVLAAGSVGLYGLTQGWFGGATEASGADVTTAPAPASALAPAAAASADPAETAAWNMADGIKSAAAYKSYLASYPNGLHAEEAGDALARIADDADWTKASGRGRAELNGYLSAHPTGAHARDAISQIAAIDETERAATAARSDAERREIERRAAEQREADRKAVERRADENAWSLAASANTAAAFRAYLNLYPNGLFADQARQAISTAAKASPPRSPAGDPLSFPNKPTQ